MSNVRSFIIGIALASSLVCNLVLASKYVEQSGSARTSSELESARSEERDLLMELIPAVTSEVNLADLEAYLGSVYSGEAIDDTDDRECVGCVVVSWRSFRFAFDETGRLSSVSATS